MIREIRTGSSTRGYFTLTRTGNVNTGGSEKVEQEGGKQPTLQLPGSLALIPSKQLNASHINVKQQEKGPDGLSCQKCNKQSNWFQPGQWQQPAYSGGYRRGTRGHPGLSAASSGRGAGGRSTGADDVPVWHPRRPAGTLGSQRKNRAATGPQGAGHPAALDRVRGHRRKHEGKEREEGETMRGH